MIIINSSKIILVPQKVKIKNKWVGEKYYIFPFLKYNPLDRAICGCKEFIYITLSLSSHLTDAILAELQSLPSKGRKRCNY